MRNTFLRHAFATLAFALVSATPAFAQGEAFSQAQLQTPTRFVSQEVASRVLSRSYPPALKRAGVTGSVQLEFVVDATGAVEPSSVKVVIATNDELAEAAKTAVSDLRFRPGVKDGRPVRSTVSLPIEYR